MCEKGFLKAILCIFNVILWIGGGLLVAIGVWMMFDPTIVNYLQIVDIKESDALLHIAAYVLMAAGGLSFVVGLFGCCGAIRESQPLLFLYAALLFVILLAEFGGAVLAFYYRSQIEGRIVNTMQQQITNDYVTNSTTWTAWNFLQQKMKCCGANGTDDYEFSRWWNDTKTREGQTVPLSCCVSNSTNPDNVVPNNKNQCQNDAKNHVTTGIYVFNDGCVDKLEEWTQTNTLYFIIIAFAIAVSQILGIIIACSLRSALKTVPGRETI